MANKTSPVPFSQLPAFFRGHLFLFDKPSRETYQQSVGTRILFICIALEGVIRPLLRAAAPWFDLGRIEWNGIALAAFMTILAIGLTRGLARVHFTQIGLCPWSRWSQSEKWYFPQALVLALLVFTFVRKANLVALVEVPAWFQTTVAVFGWQMNWGFYQEYVYRGLLQTELTRRWGSVTGILLSNLIFTFGPLHAYHFWIGIENPGHLWIFAAIFSIGLVFGILFHRSGNLWMVGVMHGFGDFFIDGLGTIR